MGRFDPVVQPLVRSVIGTAAIRAECHIVAAEFVGHHDARLPPSAQLGRDDIKLTHTALKRFAKQLPAYP
jgi:hypothetical protein